MDELAVLEVVGSATGRSGGDVEGSHRPRTLGELNDGRSGGPCRSGCRCARLLTYSLFLFLKETSPSLSGLLPRFC